LRREKPMGESDTSVLGELISPKNSRIQRRSQEIINGDIEGILTVVLERMRVRSEKIGEGVSSVRIVKPTKTGYSGLKPDSPVLSE
jgi:hypothetical protein